tara:strand:+ start:700 stop:1053 length:354 start_codon:yes stop_codon:yes gene_type:complete
MEITFNKKRNNSLQAGDILYYATIINGITTKPEVWGEIATITEGPNDFKIITNPQGNIASNYTNIVDPDNTYFLFSKDVRVNESDLKGYYANVTLQNHSKKRAELFAIGSEIVPSSK